MFCRYDLRTTDPDAAASFYSEVVGLDFKEVPSDGERSPIAVWLLHEAARARGAPAHWLGQIGVADFDAKVARLVELGSERLGPAVQGPDAIAYATLRDPFGAVVALRASAVKPRRVPVAWHQLHTRDLDAAWAAYSELFGWTDAGLLDVADPVGGHRLFAWDESGKAVGSIANTARWPGVHTHWLFYFPVADLEATLAKVKARGGGISASPVALSTGERVAPCEDPQGAAFGLYEPARR